MVTRIRLTRFGHRSLPYFNIVIAPCRSGRDRHPVEVIGRYYDSGPDKRFGNRYRVVMDFDRAKYWIGVGAQPSDTVLMLLGEVSFSLN